MDLDNLIRPNEEKKETVDKTELIEIFYQKRNMRKGWTIVQGLKVEKDFLTKLQKKFSCSAVLEKDGNIKMSGTHKHDLIDYLKEELGVEEVKIN